MNKKVKLLQGNNIELLKKLPDNSIHSCVTDGPYGLKFMNKRWDYDVPSVDFWKEVYRVLKPGGHVLSFGGTRTYHRMVVNIEDAGFEIRDCISWLYASGFPKSLNIGKAIDKLEGNERKEIEPIGRYKYDFKDNNGLFVNLRDSDNNIRRTINQTKGQSPYEGWGTGLKPAQEIICMARKTLSEKTVAENVLKWETGGINIDGCRIGNEIIEIVGGGGRKFKDGFNGGWNKLEKNIINEGRFPANIILECCCDEVIQGDVGKVKINTREAGNSFNNYDDKKGKIIQRIENYGDKGDIHTDPNCPCYMLDEQSGVSKSSKRGAELNKKGYKGDLYTPTNTDYRDDNTYGDKGGASRFFYQAKVGKKERNLGLDGFDDKETDGSIGLHSVGGSPTKDNKRINKNTHPTLKPVNLMTYLCRLVTPPNGIVLDPFMGSGSTGIAALLEGFRFVGIELDNNYFEIAKTRIENYEKYKVFLKKKNN